MGERVSAATLAWPACVAALLVCCLILTHTFCLTAHPVSHSRYRSNYTARWRCRFSIAFSTVDVHLYRIASCSMYGLNSMEIHVAPTFAALFLFSLCYLSVNNSKKFCPSYCQTPCVSFTKRVIDYFKERYATKNLAQCTLNFAWLPLESFGQNFLVGYVCNHGEK